MRPSTDPGRRLGAELRRQLPHHPGQRHQRRRHAGDGHFTYLLNCINNLPPPPPPSSGGGSSPRQTVSAGPVTTAGLPNFLPATAASLSLSTQNVSAAAPLAVTAANNADSTSGAAKDLVGVTTANLTWSGLTASATNYLYVTVATSGTLTAGATTQAPVYQWGGTPATTNGLFTFNIAEMRGYLGNGSTAPQAYLVFLGEAVTSGSAVTSAVAYAYNGRYDSGWTATLSAAGVAVTRSHNLGLPPRTIEYIIECTTADNGYAIGDQLNGTAVAGNNGAFSTNFGLSKTRNGLSFMTSGNPYGVLNKSSGAYTALTAANWRYKFVADRGW